MNPLVSGVATVFISPILELMMELAVAVVAWYAWLYL
jgi:hypothetical protein